MPRRCRGGAASSCRPRRTATSSRSSPIPICSPPTGPRARPARARSSRRASPRRARRCPGDGAPRKGSQSQPAPSRQSNHVVESPPMALSPARTVEELRELKELTGDAEGAQRVAWTETWERAREWLRAKVAPTGAELEIDAAGNQWFTLRGRSERALLIGGHIDSGPNGGWVDRCPERPPGRGVT